VLTYRQCCGHRRIPAVNSALAVWWEYVLCALAMTPKLSRLVDLRRPQGFSPIVLLNPLGVELHDAGSIQWPEGHGPVENGSTGGCGKGCSSSFCGASAGQAQAAVTERDGDLGCQGSLFPCLAQEGECSIHRFALVVLLGPRAAIGCLKAGVLPAVGSRSGEGASGPGLPEAIPAARPAAGRHGLHTYPLVSPGRRGCRLGSSRLPRAWYTPRCLAMLSTEYTAPFVCCALNLRGAARAVRPW
jgi:hypothetical protein